MENRIKLRFNRIYKKIKQTGHWSDHNRFKLWESIKVQSKNCPVKKGYHYKKYLMNNWKGLKINSRCFILTRNFVLIQTKYYETIFSDSCRKIFYAIGNFSGMYNLWLPLLFYRFVLNTNIFNRSVINNNLLLWYYYLLILLFYLKKCFFITNNKKKWLFLNSVNYK